jgi:hypothetical protein
MKIDCQNEVDVFGKSPVNIKTLDTTGTNNYSEALMQNLGTTFTANDRLAVFPQEQNQKKNLVSFTSHPPSPYISTLTKSDHMIDIRWIELV